jgi:hypothetical protein
MAATLALGSFGFAQLTIASAVPALTDTSNYRVVPGNQLVTSHTWSLARSVAEIERSHGE